MPKPTEKPKTYTNSSKAIDTTSALITGAFCAGLFNPWDRAMYLSISHHMPFFNMQNFKTPYQGFAQTVTQKTFFFAAYLGVQGQMQTHLYPYVRHQLGYSESFSQMLIGLAAGGCEGILKNPSSAIRSYTWEHNTGSFLKSFREMTSIGGYGIFLKGTRATLMRDMTFGSSYEVLRHIIHKKFESANDSDKKSKPSFLSNTAGGAISTVMASPFNYARTMQYATEPGKKPPSTMACIKSAWKEAGKTSHTGIFAKPLAVTELLMIGPGTLRVACGMGVGQWFFDWLKQLLTEHEPEIKSSLRLK